MRPTRWSIVLLLCLATSAGAQVGTITTAIGGHNGDGYPAASARINPRGMAQDAQGSIYIVDTNGQRIRKVDTAGIIHTVAGTGVSGFAGDNGPATAARLNYPTDVAVDTAGNLYIVDQLNNRIRRVDATSGIITTIAGTGIPGYNGDNQPATAAQLKYPTGVDVLPDGSVLIADGGNLRVRRAFQGTITTIAGTGTMGFNGDGILATAATLTSPFDLAHDGQGNVYVSDPGGCRVRRIGLDGLISTVAGNGTCGSGADGPDARAITLDGLGAVAFDPRGFLFVAEINKPRVRAVQLATRALSTAVPTGPLTSVSGLLVDGLQLWIADGLYASSANDVKVGALSAVMPGPVSTATRTSTPVPTMVPATPTRTVVPTGTGCLVVPCP